jgi:hypothetical protein
MSRVVHQIEDVVFLAATGSQEVRGGVSRSQESPRGARRARRGEPGRARRSQLESAVASKAPRNSKEGLLAPPGAS